MISIRVVDQVGNKRDCDFDAVPRIGECITEISSGPGEPLKHHTFRVKDVLYRIEGDASKVAILIEEEFEAIIWA